MPLEPSVQLGVTVVFEIKIYDKDTGMEQAADATPTLTLTEPVVGTPRGPFASVLKAGTTGVYLSTVQLNQAWTEGEWLGEWSYTIGANVYLPRFSFHGHKIVLTQ